MIPGFQPLTAHLDILVQLASQATRDLAALAELSAAERVTALQAVHTVSRRCLEVLAAKPKI